MPESNQGTARRPLAIEWLTSNKWPDLLPTPWLDDQEFEVFLEDLLKAQPLLGPEVRHVADVARWGVPGDNQHGIDFAGHFSDNTPAAWQCKHLEKLRPFEVQEAVNAVTFEGVDELYLVYAGVAKDAARTEMRRHANWQLWDRRDLTNMLHLLPSQTQRDILDRTWGRDVRRLFVEAPDDAFISIASFSQARLNPQSILNDLGPLFGREDEIETISLALNRTDSSYRQILIVVGPNGRGKTRTITEALNAFALASPSVPVVCLAPGHTFTVAAMRELHHGSSIIFIDDAHNDPTALAPLLHLVRRTPAMQLVIATRPSGRSSISEQVSLAQFGPEERLTVGVNELALPKARGLVKSLTADLDLPFGMRNYLAGQAVHSPHIAVITTSLISRNQFTTAIAVDEHFRELILARYQEVLLPGNIDGFEVGIVQHVLATYALIGPVNNYDEELKTRIARFCNVTVIGLTRLVRTMRDRGILVEQAKYLRVVPDVVADQVTEIVAVDEGYDTGFVARLWNEFGVSQHRKLAVSLGELDWRLTHVGGPSIMEPVWEGIRDRLRSPFYGRLGDELARLQQLAATQPAQLVTTLELLRERLDQEDRDNLPCTEDPDESAFRTLFQAPPRGRDYVRHQMPKLYARAAANDPDLLEVVLDALWALRKRDSRAPHSHPAHAERVLADQLANLTALPDESFPERILARVITWLATPEKAGTSQTPLFALKTLLVKETLVTEQSSMRQLSFHPHFVIPTAVRALRDKIRIVLLQQTQSTNLHRAGVALDLLSDALRQPHGYFGQHPDAERIELWQDDDIATIAVLHQAVRESKSTVIRRRVRDIVSWSAEFATSLHVQHAALALAVYLDTFDTLEDQLAERALSGVRSHSLEHFERLPTLDELKAERNAERERTKEFTADQVQQDQMARIRQEVELQAELGAARDKALARDLVTLGDPVAILRLLDDTARAVQHLRENQPAGLWTIWHQIGVLDPHLLGPLASGIAFNTPGPLDNELHLLTTVWLEHKPLSAVPWIANVTSLGRKDVKLQMAAGFASLRWHEQSEELSRIWSVGLTDEDPDVVQAFLAGAGSYLRLKPLEATQLVLAHGISPFSARRALDEASHHDGRSFGEKLDSKEASAILRIINCAGFGSYGIQEMITGIATTHPALILNYLAKRVDVPESLPDEIHDLGDAYDRNADALADWVLASIAEGFPSTGEVLAVAVGEYLTPTQAASLGRASAGLDGPHLIELARVLSHLDTWALRHPDLAEALLRQATTVDNTDEVREQIRRGGMFPASWGYSNGNSDELNRAHQRAQDAAESRVDERLCKDYEAARDQINILIDRLAGEHAQDEEDESGW